jgi:hypothetical protein
MAKRRRSAFVPKVIFGTMFVGVVPAVASSCGGEDSGGAQGQGGNMVMPGVAAAGFNRGVAAAGFLNGGVAAAGFFGVGAGGFGVGFGGFAVAGGAFGGTAGTRDAAADAPKDAPSESKGGAGGQDGGKRDAPFGVAAGGFAVAQQAFQSPSRPKG